METRTLNAQNYSLGLRFSLLLARIATGASFIGIGLRLFVGGGWDAWNVVGVVLPTTYPRGPIGNVLLNFWGNPAVIQLLIWALVLVGLALVFGLALRLASYGGMLIMLLMYLAVVPPASAIISQQVIYLIVLMILAVGEAGTVMGFDSFLLPLEEEYPVLRYFLR